MKQLRMFVVMALGLAPVVGATGPLGPIVVPTGPWEGPDSTEIGDDPPDSPKDPGNIQPQGRLLTPAVLTVGSAGFFGPILWPTGPWEDPDSTEIGEDPPDFPKDPGDICPQPSGMV